MRAAERDAVIEQAQITENGETSQNSTQPSPSVTMPNSAMKTSPRTIGIDSTKRSIRNANNAPRQHAAKQFGLLRHGS